MKNKGERKNNEKEKASLCFTEMSLYLFQTDSVTLGTAACVSRLGFLTLLPALKEHKLVAACRSCTDISIRFQTLNVIGIQVVFKWTLSGLLLLHFQEHLGFCLPASSYRNTGSYISPNASR